MSATDLPPDLIAADLIAACRARGWMFAAAESCTGGLVMAAMTSVPGSSHVVDRGFVTYSNTAKTEMLGVSAATLGACGAVSEPVAAAMALGALARSDAHLAVSVTGIAGPGGSDHKPEGMVCLGIALRGGGVRTVTRQFGPLGRDAVRAQSVRAALTLALEAVAAYPPAP